MRQAVFIERDGVLNHARVEGQAQISPLTLSGFHLKLEAVMPLRRLSAVGLMLLVTTNQPGLSRGYQSRRDLDLMHDMLRRMMGVQAVLVCPHEEGDGCPCRKPLPGLILEAAQKWNLALDHSFVISDKWQDGEAARLVGCTSILIQSAWTRNARHDFLVPTLDAAVDRLLLLRGQALCAV